MQLLMHIMPFAQADVRQKLLLALLAKLAVRKMPGLLAEEIPHLQIREKIAGFIDELLMRFIRDLLQFGWPLARVLH